MTGRELWDEFVRKNNVTDRQYDGWAFGSSADLLAELVVSGQKTATSSAFPLYRFWNEPLPQEGEYSVILDSKGQGVCVIRTTKVSVLPFSAVTAEHARREGEGDQSLSFWRKEHQAFFEKCMRKAGLQFTFDMKVVCEEFKVVYKK